MPAAAHEKSETIAGEKHGRQQRAPSGSIFWACFAVVAMYVFTVCIGVVAVVSEGMFIKMSREEIRQRTDLTDMQKFRAMEILDGESLDNLPTRTRNRVVKELREKGVLTDARDGLLPPNDSSYDLDEGVPKLQHFERASYETQQDRYRLFCDLYPADPTDRALREAWQKLERENSKRVPDSQSKGSIPEIIEQVMPVILKAVQLEAYWSKNGDREYMPPADWLNNEEFMHSRYNVRIGEPPPKVDQQHLINETERMLAELANLGRECIEPLPSETPLAAYRRVKAKYQQEMRNHALGVG